MMTFQEYKDNYAKKNGYRDWQHRLETTVIRHSIWEENLKEEYDYYIEAELEKVRKFIES